MADIYAIFGSLFIIGITFPGMLTAWWLFFPSAVERARLRLEHTPWQCFWLGAGLAFLLAVPTIILLALPSGPAKFIGWSLIVIVLTVSSLGSAGIAAKMGERLEQKSNLKPAPAFVQSAVLLELAVFFPLFGWFLALPLAVLTALGATGFALLRWLPRVKPAQIPAAEPATVQASLQ